MERAPAPSVGAPETLKRYRPPPAEVARYHVTRPGASETLEGVARANGIPVKTLVAFNFPGSVVADAIVPGVVNWYLRHHVGFGCPEARDGRNRALRGNEKLAIPRPAAVVELEDPMVVETPAPAAPTGVWFGGGYRFAAPAGSGGETARIACVAADGRKGFSATLRGARLGLGVGAEGGPIVALITSMRSPGQVRGELDGELDFALSDGAALDGVLGGRDRRAVEALARFAAKHGGRGAAGLRAGRTLVKYAGRFVDVATALGMGLDRREPQVLTFGIHRDGFGSEAALHHSVSAFDVESVLSL